jgi:hypothetical protein
MINVPMQRPANFGTRSVLIDEEISSAGMVNIRYEMIRRARADEAAAAKDKRQGPADI